MLRPVPSVGAFVTKRRVLWSGLHFEVVLAVEGCSYLMVLDASASLGGLTESLDSLGVCQRKDSPFSPLSHICKARFRSGTFTVLNRRDHDIDYAYTSQITPTATPAFTDVFHPVEPFRVRFWLGRTF